MKWSHMCGATLLSSMAFTLAALNGGTSDAATANSTFSAAFCVPMAGNSQALFNSATNTPYRTPDVRVDTLGQFTNDVPNGYAPIPFYDVACPLSYSSSINFSSTVPTVNGWNNALGTKIRPCRTNQGGGGGNCPAFTPVATLSAAYSLTVSSFASTFASNGDSIWIDVRMWDTDSSGSQNTIFSYFM